MTTGRRLSDDVSLRQLFEEYKQPRWVWWIMLVLLLAG